MEQSGSRGLLEVYVEGCWVVAVVVVDKTEGYFSFLFFLSVLSFAFFLLVKAIPELHLLITLQSSLS